MSDPEIIRLVPKLRNGDDEAFTQLVKRYQTYVYSVAYNRVGNFTDAEEIAQSVFIAVYEHINELRNPAKLLSWLHGITDRISLNWLRQYRKRTVSLDELGNNVTGEVQNPLDILSDEEETQVEMKQAMKVYHSLATEYRLVLNLRYMEDLPYTEIAQRLGLTKDVVRGRLYRAHQLLRRQINR